MELGGFLGIGLGGELGALDAGSAHIYHQEIQECTG